jgi:hypothetical protein
VALQGGMKIPYRAAVCILQIERESVLCAIGGTVFLYPVLHIQMSYPGHHDQGANSFQSVQSGQDVASSVAGVQLPLGNSNTEPELVITPPATIYESWQLKIDAHNDRQKSTFLMNHTDSHGINGLITNDYSMEFRAPNDESATNNQFSNDDLVFNVPGEGNLSNANDVLQKSSHGNNNFGNYHLETPQYNMFSGNKSLQNHNLSMHASSESMNRDLVLGSPDESLDSSKHSHSSRNSSIHDVRDSIGSDSGVNPAPLGFENMKHQQGVVSNGGMPAPPQDFAYQVHFKRKHQFFFLHPSAKLTLCTGDYVIVEADRGQDLGVVREVIQAKRFWAIKNYASISKTEIKNILRLATPQEVHALSIKMKDEDTVINICSEILSTAHNLPTNIVDAEYQFDRNKLTIYHSAMQRIDFREYVRDLFSVFKTRIWMQHITGEHYTKGKNRSGVGGGGNDRRLISGMQHQGYYSYHQQPPMGYADLHNQRNTSYPAMNTSADTRPMGGGVLFNQMNTQTTRSGMEPPIGAPMTTMQNLYQMHMSQQGPMQSGFQGVGIGGNKQSGFQGVGIGGNNMPGGL